jgi:WD40 repeat protein/predicted Ser/Thr protein kinase
MDPKWGRRWRWSDDDRTRLIDERCDEYESEWRALRAPRIEDYLRGLDGETQSTLWLELVRLDHELRRGQGETTTLADYRESCPDPILLLDPSTARLDSNGDESQGTIEPDGTRGLAAEFGPAADRLGPFWIAGRGEPAPEPSLDTEGSIDQAVGPTGPTRITGPPREGHAEGLGGLADARRGTRFGDYELLDKLGAGGMGVVYEARQTGLNRVVALKMLKAGILADEHQIRWFRREAEAVAALDHPNIVPVLDSGEHLGVLYYSMKRIDGRTLQQSLGRFRDHPEAIARLVARVADAIAHAHQRGVLHRDIKPSNILVDERGEPYVIDFGLARWLGIAGESLIAPPGGTPRYMSPEQARGDHRAITEAADIYGLGAVLYTLLTGRPPFTGDSPVQVIHDVAHVEPPRPRDRDPQVDPDLETICLKCLRKEPKDRYPSAGELADDLNRWLDGRPILARPASMPERLWKGARRRPAVSSLVGALAIALLAGIGGIVWQWRAALAAREGMRGALVVARANEDRAIASEDDARHLAYAATLNLAERDWRDVNVAQVLHHLDETRPPEGKSDLRGFEWYYLDRLARRQGRILAGHTDYVLGVAYSRDGRRVASASNDRTIRIWDAATGQAIRTLTATKQVWAVAFHPDGARLASAGSEGEVILWDAGTGQPIHRLPGHEPAKSVNALAFSPDGKTLATSSQDGTVKLWDVDAGKQLHSLASRPVSPRGWIVFSPDGQTLASIGGGTPNIRVWDVATGRLLPTLEGDGPGVFSSLAISPDGKTFATGTHDGRIQLWDAAAGKVARVLADPHNPHIIMSLSFSRDGKILASASWTGEVALWDHSTGFLVRTIRGHTKAIMDIAFSPDGVHLASACWDGSVRLWDTSRAQEARSLHVPDVPRAVTFGPDGSYLASAGAAGTITIRDQLTGQVVRPIPGHSGIVRSLAISPDGRRMASAGEDRTVRVWEVATGREIHTLPGHAGAVFEVAFSPDGKTLASASEDRTVKLWDADTGRAVRTLEGHISAAKAVAFSPDGKTLATAGMDGFILIWDLADGRRLRAIPAGPDGIDSIAISPDGRWLASGSLEPTLKIWEIATGKEARALRGHSRAINRVVFSPDGRRLVSASDDNTVRIWDPASGRELMVLRAHAGGVWGLAISPDGARIASAGFDRTIKLWEADAGPQLPRNP